MAETRKAADELAEDLVGFGRRELFTVKDLVLRPAKVLQAWMEIDADGGGAYARPLRLYLGLNAVLMLVLFLRGGSGFVLNDLPAEFMTPLLQQTGKSRDAFISDADGWMTLVMVPILSASYSLAAVGLLRLWDAADLGWRRGFRASFAWLCAWTVPMMPLAWWGYGFGSTAAIIGAIIPLIGVIAFFRMGRGRWYQAPLFGVAKGVALMIVVQAAAMIGGILVGAIGLLGALVSP